MFEGLDMQEGVFLNQNLYVLLLDSVSKVKYFGGDSCGIGEEIILEYVNRYLVFGKVKQFSVFKAILIRIFYISWNSHLTVFTLSLENSHLLLLLLGDILPCSQTGSCHAKWNQGHLWCQRKCTIPSGSWE